MLHSAPALQHILAHMKYNQTVVQVSADNLARHPIPGEKTKKVAPYSFADYVVGQQTRAAPITHPKHIPFHEPLEKANISSRLKHSETSPNGNDIHPEEQLQQMNEATLQLHEDIKAYDSLLKSYQLFTNMGR
jgi:flagellar basal body rod protein FlgB